MKIGAINIHSVPLTSHETYNMAEGGQSTPLSTSRRTTDGGSPVISFDYLY